MYQRNDIKQRYFPLFILVSILLSNLSVLIPVEAKDQIDRPIDVQRLCGFNFKRNNMKESSVKGLVKTSRESDSEIFQFHNISHDPVYRQGYTELPTLTVSNKAIISTVESLDNSNLFNQSNNLLFQSNTSITVPQDYYISNANFSVNGLKSAQTNYYVESNVSTTEVLSYEVNLTHHKAAISMSFNISNELVNLTSFRTRVNGFLGSLLEEPDMEAHIEYIDKINKKPNGTIIDGSKVSLVDFVPSSSEWTTIKFNKPITLQNGTYAIVLIDKSTNSPDDGYYGWQITFDNETGNNGTSCLGTPNILGEGFDWDDKYSGKLFDMPLGISFYVLNDSTSLELKQYDITEVDFHYNSVETTEKTFNANISANNHIFTTNVSVQFQLNIIKKVANDSISIIGISYSVINNSNAFWNISFSTSSLISAIHQSGEDEFVSNHTVEVFYFPSEWNGSSIYWDNETAPEYPTLTNNPNVTWDGISGHYYTFGNESMVINCSTLSKETYWTIVFNATNYLDTFNIKREGNQLIIPYKANVTDVIEFIIEGLNLGNYSLSIYTPQNKLLLSDIDINDSSQSFSIFWDINSSLNQTTDVDGLYSLELFYQDIDKPTEVGIFTREILLFVNTTLTVFVPNEVLINSTFEVNTSYLANHNDTIENGALVTYFTSWDISGTLVQPQSHKNYTATLSTKGAVIGLNFVYINASLYHHTNYTNIKIAFFIVEATDLTTNITSPCNIYFTDNLTVLIQYNDSTKNYVANATIKVNGSLAIENSTLKGYLYTFNSTYYQSIGIYKLIVQANKTNYQTKELLLDVNVNPCPTSIENQQGLINNTSTVSRAYADNNDDQFTTNLRFYNNLTQKTINTSLLEVSSLLPFQKFKQTNLNWSIIIFPNQTGLFHVNITFGLPNFKNSTFIFFLKIDAAPTEINVLDTQPIEVLFLENCTFGITFNNSYYHSYVTNANISIEEEYSSFLFEQNNIYYFNYTYSLNKMGLFEVHIIASKLYHKQSSITIQFITQAREVILDCQDTNPSNDNNSQTYVNVYYSATYNFSVIVIDYKTNRSVSGLNITTFGSGFCYINNSLYNFSFSALFSVESLIIVNSTFKKYGYHNKSWLTAFKIISAPTKLGGQLYPNNYMKEANYSDTVVLWLIWSNNVTGERIDGANTTFIGNGSSYITVLNSINGNYSFEIHALSLTVLNCSIKFSHFNFTSYVYHFSLNVSKSPSQISDSLIASGETFYSIFDNNDYFWVFIIDPQHNRMLNDSTPDIFVNGSINIDFVQVVNGNHTFSLNCSEVGFFKLVIIFEIEFYEPCNYSIFINITKANSEITDYSIPPPYVDIEADTSIDFWIIWTDTDHGVNITDNDPTIESPFVSFLNANQGNHSFHFNGSTENVLITITLETNNYKKAVYTIFIQVNAIPSEFDYNKTSITQNYYLEIGYGEIFIFYIQWNDSIDHQGINASNVISDGDIYFTGVYQGNHSFEYHANSLGLHFNLKIRFYLTSYKMGEFIVNFHVVKGNSEVIVSQTTFDLYYGQNNSFNLTWQSKPELPFSYVQRINSSIVYCSNGLLSLSNYSNGNYYFKINGGFYPADEKTYYVTIFLNSALYINQTIIVNIRVHRTPTTLVSSIVNNSIISSDLYFGQNITFWFVLKDNLTDNIIETVNVQITGNYSIFIYEVGVIDGNWSMGILANRTEFSFAILLLSNENYSATKLFFYIHIQSIPTKVPEIFIINNTIWYESTLQFNLSWEFQNNTNVRPSQLHFYFNNSNTNADDSFDWSYDQLNNKIIINTSVHRDLKWTIGNVTLIIYSQLYGIQNRSISVVFEILALNTVKPDIESSYSIVYGQSLQLVIPWYIEHYNLTVVDHAIEVIIHNETELFYSYDWDTHLLTINTSFWPKGNYLITLNWLKYGYINQSIDFLVSITPFKVYIDVILPEKLIENAPFIIKVFVGYNRSLATGTGAMLSDDGYIGISGADIICNISIIYDNGTTLTHSFKGRTNNQGWAEVVVDKQYTHKASKFLGISVAYLGNYAYSEEKIQLTGFNYKFKSIGIDLAGLGVISVIIILLTSVIVFASFKGYISFKERKVELMDSQKAIIQDFKALQSIRVIFARHRSGIQFYSEITSKGLAQDIDAVVGMSTAISAFLGELSMTDNDKSETAIEISEFERLEREGLFMLAWFGKESSIVIISEKTLPKVYQDRLKRIGTEIESNYAKELTNFYSNTLISPKDIDQIVKKEIPLSIFYPLVLDKNKLRSENYRSLSLENKRLFRKLLKANNVQDIKEISVTEIFDTLTQLGFSESKIIGFLMAAIRLGLIYEKLNSNESK